MCSFYYFLRKQIPTAELLRIFKTLVTWCQIALRKNRTDLYATRSVREGWLPQVLPKLGFNL